MNDQIQTAEESQCVIENLKLDAATIVKLIRKFTDEELCPCALETFHAEYDEKGHSLDSIKEALYRGVINEMLLRGLATAVKK